jgi:pimeloyl-ACP methyl ester carboxylesterase
VTGPVRALALGLVLAVIPAACSGDDGERADRPVTVQPDEANGFTPHPIVWEDCDRLECATVEVPVDYGAPAGTRSAVYVSRVPATGDRIGPLVFNPGGPGASPSSYLPSLAATLPGAITEHFDLVGIEPRGRAGSGPINCGMDVEDLYRVDPTIDGPADRAALLDISARYTQGCADRVGFERLARVGTVDVARDMDTVRAAMGDGQLSFLGVSYGTAVGQVYGRLIPDRERAMVLDGVLELGHPGLEDARDQAAGFELALDHWVDDCRADRDCPVHDDPLRAVERVLAAAERGDGIASRGADRSAGPGEVNLGLGYGLYSPLLWGRMAEAVADGTDGDGTGLVALADAYLAGTDWDVYFAVNCLDFNWPTDADEVLAAAKAVAETAPHFGEAVVTDYVRCATWPVPAEPLAASPLPGLPPVLVVSTTGDPATPHAAAVRLSEALESAVLLTKDGEGHGAVNDGDPCIDETVATYLVDLRPPAPGTVCRDGKAA